MKADDGPTEAPHGTTTTSEVLPTVSRPDGLLRAFVTSSGNDREKMPVIIPTGEGPQNRIFFALRRARLRSETKRTDPGDLTTIRSCSRVFILG